MSVFIKMLLSCVYSPRRLCCGRISLEKDTKVLNAATFTLQREDHTVGNLLRMCERPRLCGGPEWAVCVPRDVLLLLCCAASNVSNLHRRPASSWKTSRKLRARPACGGVLIYQPAKPLAGARCKTPTRCSAQSDGRAWVVVLPPRPPRSAPAGRRQLHRDKEVLFAGYKLPHPLEYRMLVKVQTRGRRTPRDVLDAALSDLVDEFEDMKAKFRVRLITVV